MSDYNLIEWKSLLIFHKIKKKKWRTPTIMCYYVFNSEKSVFLVLGDVPFRIRKFEYL